MSLVRPFLLLALVATAAPALAQDTAPTARRAATELGFALAPDDRVDLLRTRPDGYANRIAGQLATAGDDVLARAEDFAGRSSRAFGLLLPEQLGAARALGVDGRHAFVPQTVHGHELRGHGLTLRFDDETLVLAHGAFSDALVGVAPPSADPAASAQRAFEQAGFDADEAELHATVGRAAWITSEGPQLVYLAHVRKGPLPYVLEIDAWTGELLASREDWLDMGKVKTGNFRVDGEDVAFDTRKAKGRVFKGVGSAFKAKSRNTRLPSIARQSVDEELFPTGSPTGRFAFMIEDGLPQVADPERFNFAFHHDDLAPAGELGRPAFQVFDLANCYFWLDRMGRFCAKLLGDAFPADYAVPTFVNYDEGGKGFFNAFFSSGDLDGSGPLDPGFMLFGELTVLTNDTMDDFSRDPSIVAHEYTHMVVDKMGGMIADVGLDEPSRGLSEGLADYLAGALLRDPATGAVFVQHAFGGDLGGMPAFRDMTLPLTVDENLFDVLGPETGLPEEHAVGNIFSSAMWRTRQTIGRRVADALFMGELLAIPQTSAVTGFPSVDIGNAAEAYPAYAFGVFEAWFDLLRNASSKKVARKASRMATAFISHGIAGAADGLVPVFEPTDGKLKLTLDPHFLGGAVQHVIDVVLIEGQFVDISVTGRAGTGVNFTLLADEGTEVAATKEKKVNEKATKASQKKIEVLQSGTYRIVVTNGGQIDGEPRYRLKVRAR